MAIGMSRRLSVFIIVGAQRAGAQALRPYRIHPARVISAAASIPPVIRVRARLNSLYRVLKGSASPIPHPSLSASIRGSHVFARGYDFYCP